MKIISIYLWLWFTFILKLKAEECSDSKKDNWIVISTNCTEKKCPLSKLARQSFWDSNSLSKKSMYYSEVCMNQNSHQTKFSLRKLIKRPIDFKTHCGNNGNACKSGTTTVDYKQCYPGGSGDFDHALGMSCLSRLEKDRNPFQKKKEHLRGRKNLREQLKEVTEKYLICYGKAQNYTLDEVCKWIHRESKPCDLKDGTVLELCPFTIGNHQLCQDFSFWSDITKSFNGSCINVDEGQNYPVVRKCISHDIQTTKELISKNCDTSWNYQIRRIETCPNSKTKIDCNQTDDFYCSSSMSCIKEKEKCDGIVHCYYGEDEDLKACAHIYPESATITCLENNRGDINITIKATPCNGNRECKDIDDEDCEQKWSTLIIPLVIVLVGIILLSTCVHIITVMKYPAVIIDSPEAIPNTIDYRRRASIHPIPRSISMEYRPNLRGNILAEIKNSNDLVTCANMLNTPGRFDAALSFLKWPVIKFIQLPFQIFVKYLDLIKDIILIHRVVVSMTAGAGLLTIFENWNIFPSVVVFMFIISIIVPYALGGARLAARDQDTQIIFMPAHGHFRRIVLSILTFFLSPFHTLILYLRKYHIELKLRANPGSRLFLLEQEVMNHHLCQHIKLELGLETLSQLTLQIILLLYAITSTRTTEGLNQIFNEDTKLSGELKNDYKVIFLYASIFWSVMSNVNSHIKGLSAHREYFPGISKAIAIVYAFFGITTRVLALIAFFTPCLGLFSVQSHWKGEQINWHPALIENFVMNKSVMFDGSLPVSVDSIFISPRENNSISLNASLTESDDAILKYFQINGTIQFGNSSQIPWNHLDRWKYNLNGLEIPPHYSLYTLVNLKYYFLIFLVILFTQTLSIFFVKIKLAKAFSKFNILEKIIHCIECTNLPYNAQEWDTLRNGDAQVHISRMKANQLEGLVLIFVNLVFKMTMLVPLYVLAFKMKERHIFLYNSISILKEEHDAMITITLLVVGFTSYVVIGTLFEAIFFNLYNSTYHPFAKILDLSDEVFMCTRRNFEQQILPDLDRDMGEAIQMSEEISCNTSTVNSQATLVNPDSGDVLCQKRTHEYGSKDKRMKKYYSYLPRIFGIIFITAFVFSMWHVKNELENGYCDFYEGQCCAQWLIGDGTCDQRNNFSSCGNYDGGDCRPPNIAESPNCPHNPELILNGICDDHLKTKECNFDGGDCCNETLTGDRYCDDLNNFESCFNFDDGDCRSTNDTSDHLQECPHNPEFIGDEQCDDRLKTLYCDFDGGDCCNSTLIGNGICEDQNNFSSCYNFDGGDCLSNGQCNLSLIGDGKCDRINIHANCSFDIGDCCTKPLIANGICDDVNNFSTCENYDGGDCRPPNITEWQNCPHNPGLIGDGQCNEHLKFKANCNHDGGDCCDESLIGNKKCDGFNNFESCFGKDKGDCRSSNDIDFPDCPQNPSLIGDGVCDYANHNDKCNFDSEDCSECLTNGGGSPNTKCALPFIYQGKTFTSCTRFDDPNDAPWCSTLVDENGRHVSHQGKWGFCGSRCPIPSCGETHSEPLVPKLIKCTNITMG